TLGPPAQFTPRATFATNFFAAGGIAAIDGGELPTRDAMIDAFRRSGARLACLCGADAAYAREGVEAARALSGAGALHVYVAEPAAGLPWGAAASPIHAGCDMLELLTQAQAVLGLG